jgi:pectate lyase
MVHAAGTPLESLALRDLSGAAVVPFNPEVFMERFALSLFVSLRGFGLVPVYAQVEGYGKGATGGVGGSVCTVASGAEQGAGSLDSCIQKGGNQTIQFAVATAKVRGSYGRLLSSNITLDGCANGRNGVTLDQQADAKRGIDLVGPISNVVIRCIRFQGSGKIPGFLTEFDLLSMDGEGGPVSSVLVERSTFVGGTDGALDAIADVSDVTIQYNLLYDNGMTQLIKYDRAGLFPRNLSIHHNVYTANGERNPQMRGGIFADLVSNIVGPGKMLTDAENMTTYSRYGTLLWNSTTPNEGGPGNVRANVVASAYLDGGDTIEIRTDAGANAAGIYLSDNHCPGTCPASPASAPNPVAAAAVVTVTPISQLASILPKVGAPNRTTTDQARIDAVAALLPSARTPVSVPQAR